MMRLLQKAAGRSNAGGRYGKGDWKAATHGP